MIQAQKVNFKSRETYIINEIDFSCENGEFIAILGPNGAGKSTFLSVLANELHQKGNKILLKSCEYDKWCDKELPKHKAKFSQHHNNDIPLNVEDVVMMGRYPYFDHTPSDADKKAIQHSMECIDICPLKSREYNHLSGGEKQRVHLARVLSQLNNDVENKLLFLDEPLNNLDVLHQHKILELIKDFTAKGNTAIVVLHDLNLAAQFADKILLLQKGQKVSYDIPENVLTQEIISRVYNFPCVVTKNPVNNNPLIIFG
ncbi:MULTISPECIES: heme ABC transporter ATP-binding protein [Myroides]|uniref:Heme ABC transporter ATP-binding protein n=1 Tax=Myroides albus TaxID=2562892 RepID=A0A6I3LI06_9FLAO|nr:MULTISPECIES: heme ABC transporter ATP-binding protein [Myroides]MTG97883.1 heme ABC transporter ATP-binding protein [Myroides albus]MVX35283.1 heme ABC transporter ATP-binding protein [Myroides sp. LoEW2-1]UVD81070.1 heme ABC transporter ATP-binding protein [Myroides albus]